MMTDDAGYNDNIIEKTLRRLDVSSDFEMPIYLLGGSAMITIGSKSTTKDIDVILKEKQDLDHLTNALNKIGFERVIPSTNDELVRTAMHFQDQSGLKFDIFFANIAGKLEFSDKMRERSIFVEQLVHLEIKRLSNEDLFLLKAVSGRDVDLDDMSKLFQAGLDWTIIKQELKDQTVLTDRIWSVIFLDSLHDLETEYDLRCPNLNEFRELAEEEMETIAKISNLSRI